MTAGFEQLAIRSNLKAGYGAKAEFASPIEYRQRYILAALLAILKKESVW